MQNKLRILCLVLLAFTFMSVIYCQDTEAGTTADLTYVKQRAADFFALVYKNDINATDYIYWENLSVNGEDYSETYWDAYDYGEEDVFMEDTIGELYADLHYAGDSEDTFTDWVCEAGDGIALATAHNKKKSIALTFTNKEVNAHLIIEIIISDYVK